jgi:hypothetical protein
MCTSEEGEMCVCVCVCIAVTSAILCRHCLKMQLTEILDFVYFLSHFVDCNIEDNIDARQGV